MAVSCITRAEGAPELGAPSIPFSLLARPEAEGDPDQTSVSSTLKGGDGESIMSVAPHSATRPNRRLEPPSDPRMLCRCGGPNGDAWYGGRFCGGPAPRPAAHPARGHNRLNKPTLGDASRPPLFAGGYSGGRFCGGPASRPAAHPARGHNRLNSRPAVGGPDGGCHPGSPAPPPRDSNRGLSACGAPPAPGAPNPGLTAEHSLPLARRE